MKKILYSPITLVAIGVVVLVAVYGVIDIIPKYADAARAESNVLKKKEALEIRQNNLEEELIKLKTEGGIEETIRERLNVVKEGENVIMIVDQKPKVEDESLKPKKTWWQRMFN